MFEITDPSDFSKAEAFLLRFLHGDAIGMDGDDYHKLFGFQWPPAQIRLASAAARLRDQPEIAANQIFEKIVKDFSNQGLKSDEAYGVLVIVIFPVENDSVPRKIKLNQYPPIAYFDVIYNLCQDVWKRQANDDLVIVFPDADQYLVGDQFKVIVITALSPPPLVYKSKEWFSSISVH